MRWNIKVEEELGRRAKVRAAEEGKTLQEWVVGLAEAELLSHSDKVAKRAAVPNVRAVQKLEAISTPPIHYIADGLCEHGRPKSSICLQCLGR